MKWPVWLNGNWRDPLIVGVVIVLVAFGLAASDKQPIRVIPRWWSREDLGADVVRINDLYIAVPDKPGSDTFYWYELPDRSEVRYVKDGQAVVFRLHKDGPPMPPPAQDERIKGELVLVGIKK